MERLIQNNLFLLLFFSVFRLDSDNCWSYTVTLRDGIVEH